MYHTYRKEILTFSPFYNDRSDILAYFCREMCLIKSICLSPFFYVHIPWYLILRTILGCKVLLKAYLESFSKELHTRSCWSPSYPEILGKFFWRPGTPGILELQSYKRLVFVNVAKYMFKVNIALSCVLYEPCVPIQFGYLSLFKSSSFRSKTCIYLFDGLVTCLLLLLTILIISLSDLTGSLPCMVVCSTR